MLAQSFPGDFSFYQLQALTGVINSNAQVMRERNRTERIIFPQTDFGRKGMVLGLPSVAEDSLQHLITAQAACFWSCQLGGRNS